MYVLCANKFVLETLVTRITRNKKCHDNLIDARIQKYIHSNADWQFLSDLRTIHSLYVFPVGLVGNAQRPQHFRVSCYAAKLLPLNPS